MDEDDDGDGNQRNGKTLVIISSEVAELDEAYALTGDL